MNIHIHNIYIHTPMTQLKLNRSLMRDKTNVNSSIVGVVISEDPALFRVFRYFARPSKRCDAHSWLEFIVTKASYRIVAESPNLS